MRGALGMGAHRKCGAHRVNATQQMNDSPIVTLFVIRSESIHNIYLHICNSNEIAATIEIQ